MYNASTNCTKCNTGKFSDGVAPSICSDCTGGKYTNSTGSVNCLTCPQSKYSSAGSSTCTTCATGKFSDVLAASICSDCAGGKFTNSTGSVNCLGCPRSTYSSAGSSTCTSCALNSDNSWCFSFGCDRADTCSCNAGYYGPNGGTCTAIAYASGQYDGCKDDPTYSEPGYPDCAQHKTNYEVFGFLSCPYFGVCSTCCQSCAPQCGRLNTCTDCPANSDASYSPCTFLSNCTCNAGYEGPNGGPCTACVAGKFKDITSSGTCIVCPGGTYSIAPAATSQPNCRSLKNTLSELWV